MSKRMYVYTDQLEKFLISSKKIYIPRKLDKNESLKIYKKYWWDERNELVYVKYISEIYKTNYYFLESNIGNHCISDPIQCELYELNKPTPNILNVKEIVNSGSFKGYFIKWWLFNHMNINKYKYFIPYILKNSDNCIDDNSIYTVKGNLENKIYKDCRIILEKRILW